MKKAINVITRNLAISIIFGTIAASGQITSAYSQEITPIDNNANSIINSEDNEPNLIFSLDFESDGWQSAFENQRTWEKTVTRVTNKPHSGSYCLRGNLLDGKIDPITGLPGQNNNLLEFTGNDISSQTPDMIFIRYWRRLDNANWSGFGKSEYFVDDIEGTRAYFTRLGGWLDNYSVSGNGAYPQEENIEDWGYLKAYLSGPAVGGPDSQWNKFEFFFDYRDPSYKYVQLWINDQLLVATDKAIGNVIDGKVRLNEAFHLRGFQLLYVTDDAIGGSTDGIDYACGFQYDDFEVYDGNPKPFEFPSSTIQHSVGTIDFSIYPNPCDSEFIIAVKDGNYEEFNIELINSYGVLIYSSTIKSKTTSIVTDNLPVGVYFVRIFSNSESHIEKVVIR